MLYRKLPIYLLTAAMIFGASMMLYACQNKRTVKTMNDKMITEPDSSYRLLTIANLQQADSGQKVIAWFFETPQIFEFSLQTEEAPGIYNLLNEAKGLPVNIQSKSEAEKNTITRVIPATTKQLNQYNQQKSQREKAVQIKPPGN
jgi:hypothetical protein